jgi:hypothetical protein
MVSAGPLPVTAGSEQKLDVAGTTLKRRGNHIHYAPTCSRIDPCADTIDGALAGRGVADDAALSDRSRTRLELRLDQSDEPRSLSTKV